MSEQRQEEEEEEEEEKPPYWKLKVAFGVLALDALISLVFLAPLFHWVRHIEDASSWSHYNFATSLSDLALLAVIRLSLSGLALLISYCKAEIPPEYHFDLYHPITGERKSREELEQEALEEDFGPWFWRFLTRPSFGAELVAGVVTQVWCMAKCLVRMNLEIGTHHGEDPSHPVFWLAILATAVLAALEASYLESMGRLAAQYGKEHRCSGGIQTPAILRTISSQLLAPLLEEQDEEQPDVDDEADVSTATELDEEHQRAVSDIRSDTEYKAQWSDLLVMCWPDLHLIAFAFVFLLNAAAAQVLIPIFLGKILDALVLAFGNPEDDTNRDKSMWEIPGFMTNVKLLVAASVLAGVL